MDIAPMNNVHYKDKPAHTWLPRLRAFEVSFRPATTHRPDRVRIKDANTGQIKIISYCYKTGSIIDQAFDYLQDECGIEIDHIVPLSEGYLLTTSDRHTKLT
tara:strand:+ start:820 stop:1125 length:306 start_codon:yes stop_codon:yes gene_type:complete